MEFNEQENICYFFAKENINSNASCFCGLGIHRNNSYKAQHAKRMPHTEINLPCIYTGCRPHKLKMDGSFFP